MTASNACNKPKVNGLRLAKHEILKSACVRQFYFQFFKESPHCSPYDPAISLLGIHTKETRIERDVYPNVHRSTVYNSQDTEAT